MKKKQEKEKRSLAVAIVLAAAWKICFTFVIFVSIAVLLKLNSAHLKMEKHKNNMGKIEYVTEIDGYDMSDLSIYSALRVYDLLDANGFTDYEGRGYNRSYNYGIEDFQNLKGLDESYLYGFYCATSEENFNDVLSVLGYDALDKYLIEKEYVDKYGNPSISVWNDASLAYIAELLEQEKDEKTVK